MTRNVLSMCYIKPNKLGAFETFMLKLTEALQGRSCRHVIVFQEAPPDWLARRFTDAGACLESVDFSQSNWRGLINLLGLLHKYRPRVTYWHFFSYWSPCMMLGTAFGGVDVFVDRVSGKGRYERPLLLDLALHAVNAWFLLRRVRFIGISHFVCERIIHSRKLPARVVRCVLNGIDIREDPEDVRAKLHRKLDVDDEVTLVCSTGHLIPEKGFDVLLQALPDILLGFPKTLFLLVGEGPEKERLSQLGRELNVADSIRFLGRRNNVKEIMRGCDLFVLVPRWQEAFGFVFAEAQASGLPVVASRVGGIPEVVQDGHTGLVVASENSRDLARAVKALLADPTRRKQMGHNAADRARTLFTLDRMVREYINVGLKRKS